MRESNSPVTVAAVIFMLIFSLFAFNGAGAGLQSQQPCKITASDAAAYDYFGFAVSCSSNYVAVGAPYHNGSGDKSGAVYIFKYSQGGWLEQTKLCPADGDENDCFGFAVSMSGDCVVIGAPYNDASCTDCGAAYVFNRIGNSWFQQAKLTPADPSSDKLFGESVCIWGDYIIVGSRYDCELGQACGAAYIFKRQGGNWRQQAKLTASEPKSYGQFGWSVAIRDGYAIVGAIGADITGYDGGEAYIFKQVGSQWLQDAKLLPRPSIGEAGFGFAVSISPALAVVAAPFEYCGRNKEAGSVYIFRPAQTGWMLETNLNSYDCSDADQFGKSVCLDNDFVVVGTEFEDTGKIGQTGSAYVFRCQGKTWVSGPKLTAPDCQAYDRFGASVAVSSGCIVSGAAYDDDKGNNSGSVYIFGQPVVPADLTGDKHVDFADFAVLASHWLRSDCQLPDWCNGSDINHDGRVDLSDLQSLLENWLCDMN